MRGNDQETETSQVTLSLESKWDSSPRHNMRWSDVPAFGEEVGDLRRSRRLPTSCLPAILHNASLSSTSISRGVRTNGRRKLSFRSGVIVQWWLTLMEGNGEPQKCESLVLSELHGKERHIRLNAKYALNYSCLCVLSMHGMDDACLHKTYVTYQRWR